VKNDNSRTYAGATVFGAVGFYGIVIFIVPVHFYIQVAPAAIVGSSQYPDWDILIICYGIRNISFTDAYLVKVRAITG
jgi:hypothetical protein